LDIGLLLGVVDAPYEAPLAAGKVRILRGNVLKKLSGLEIG